MRLFSKLVFSICIILLGLFPTSAYSTGGGPAAPESRVSGDVYIKASPKRDGNWDLASGPDLLLCKAKNKCYSIECKNSYSCTFANINLGYVDWKEGGYINLLIYDNDKGSSDDKIGSLWCNFLPRKGKVISCEASGHIEAYDVKIRKNTKKE